MVATPPLHLSYILPWFTIWSYVLTSPSGLSSNLQFIEQSSSCRLFSIWYFIQHDPFKTGISFDTLKICQLLHNLNFECELGEKHV